MHVAILKRSATVARLVAGFAVVVALAGCTAQTNVPRPTATATGSATPRPLTADTPFDKGDAYLACTNFVLGYALISGTSDPQFVDFAHAYIVKRTDGLFYVYVEYTDDNPKATMHLGAAECILGGTLGSPNYQLTGYSPRLSVAQRDPNQSLQ